VGGERGGGTQGEKSGSVSLGGGGGKRVKQEKKGKQGKKKKNSALKVLNSTEDGVGRVTKRDVRETGVKKRQQSTRALTG